MDVRLLIMQYLPTDAKKWYNTNRTTLAETIWTEFRVLLREAFQLLEEQMKILAERVPVIYANTTNTQLFKITLNFHLQTPTH